LLLLVFVFLLTAAVTLNKPDVFYVMAIFFSLFFFFRDLLWLAPALALPALTLGEALKFELTPYWNYEYTLAEALLALALGVFLLDKFLNQGSRRVSPVRNSRGILNFAGVIQSSDGLIPLGESANISNGVKFDRLGFFLLAYFALAAASFWQVVDLHYYLFGLKAIFFSFAGYLLAVNLIDTKAKLRVFLYSLTAALLILSLQVFFKFYQLGFSEKFFFERKLITLPLGPLATVASIITLLLPVVFVFFLAEKKIQAKAVILPVFCFGLFALFVTLGKAAILASLVAFAYLFMRLKKVRPYFLAALVVGAVLGAVFLAPLASGLITRVKTTFIDTNTQFRVLEYKTAGTLIAEHPIFGVGAGQQLHYFKQLLNFDTSELVNNFFLQALIDFGLLGFAGAMMIFWSLASKAGQIGRQTRSSGGQAGGTASIYACGLIAMLLASVVTGMLEVTFFALPYAIIFWPTAGALMNLKNYDLI
jgi:O-antigen ligase